MALQDIVAQIVSGLGYDLVEIDRSAGGLLRITIDLPWVQAAEGEAQVEQFITVEDCEKVTRQLQFALEVDGVDYRRLEVSSPGIDRPLRAQGWLSHASRRGTTGTSHDVSAIAKKGEDTVSPDPLGGASTSGFPPKSRNGTAQRL